MELDSPARQRLCLAAVSILTAWAAVFRSSGLNPPTLWNDDVWVASLTRLDSVVDALLVPTAVPPAFLSALWVTHRIVPDPELALQLVPFMCALHHSRMRRTVRVPPFSIPRVGRHGNVLGRAEPEHLSLFGFR